MNRKILLLLAMSLVFSSCREARDTPPLKVGTYYDITFASKTEGLGQQSFRVVAIGAGSWVQVETYGDSNSAFGNLLMMGLASQPGKDPQELERRKQATIHDLKATVKLKWINLQAAALISETDPKNLGFLKDL